MARKKPERKIISLEPSFNDILVCKKKEHRPFLEILIEKPENVSRQNLGVLFGIFQVDDRSEDSSYVVNYLISIIKKEYFLRVNRGAVENFEATLHKANLALAKLAAHENINWIGKINAVCAVIEKNNLLLSQTGNISAFLLRGSSITEITENSADAADSNPLKTFQDIISGKIEKTDKLLFSTKEIFDIFSLEEIKKSALKFSAENFVRFLNTALVNELDNTATLVVAINEKEELEIAASPTKKLQKLNAFSQMAFRKKTSPKNIEKPEAVRKNLPVEKTQEIIQELKSEIKIEEKSDFVDKKTGHIYIKDDADFLAKTYNKKDAFDFSIFTENIKKISGPLSNIFLNAKNYWISGKNKLRFSFISLKQNWKAKNAQKKMEKEIQAARLKKEFLPAAPEDLEKKELRDSLRAKPKKNYIYRNLFQKIKLFFQKLELSGKLKWLGGKIIDGTVVLLRILLRGLALLFVFGKNQWINYRNNKVKNNTDQNNVIKNSSATPAISAVSAISATSAISTIPLPQEKLNKFLPDFSRMKQTVEKFNYRQKLYAVLVLLLILIIPYWIAKWENKTTENKIAVVEEIPPIVLPLAQDKNVVHIEKTDEVYAGNVNKILNLNDKFFTLAENEIIDLENKKSFPIPQEFQNPELFFAMNDLNLIFLIKNNQIISLAPTTGKFQPSALAFPENGKIADGKTFLTYLYLLDKKNNQIYRYPRAEGGFGEKTNWLKENMDLSGAKNMTINENVFILDDKNIFKLFRGKKQGFSVENTTTKILPDKLYTERKLNNLYVLDKTNARIIKLDNDGKILAQYYNPNIANATDFSVSEENNLIYISNENGVGSFEME